jgi:NADH:ubiquinone oxidoreductase subunit
MATWHQEQAGLVGLYKPHETGFKVVMNPRGEMASAIVFDTLDKARAYVARQGGAILPPYKAPPLWYVWLSYRVPSGRESVVTYYIRESDQSRAFEEGKRRLAYEKRRKVASPVVMLRCDAIDGIATS